MAVSVFGAKPRRTDGRVDVGMHGGTGHLKSARPFQGEPLSSSSSRDSGRETASAAFTNERTKARSFNFIRTQGPRAPVSPDGDGILLRRRIDFGADKEILMSLLDEKRIAHSFGTCVPIFQGRCIDEI